MIGGKRSSIIISVVQISLSATFSVSVRVRVRRSSFSHLCGAENWLRFKNGEMFCQPTSLLDRISDILAAG